MAPTLDSGPFVWEDWLRLQDAPTHYIRPDSVEQLRAYLEPRNVRRLHIRGVGAGHSTTPVARPWRGSTDTKRAGIVVKLDKMPLHAAAEAPAWWKPGVDHQQHLVRVEGGATIRRLNQRFFQFGLAFPNLGSYDGQTIAGAVATGTHGTGMVTPPLCDLVASIELLTFLPGTGGAAKLSHVRVEPAGGPTDEAKFNADFKVHGMTLIPEDDAFYSAVVGLGFFGIVTALTLRLTPAFWLEETQEFLDWEALEPQLPGRADQDWFDFVMSARPSKVGPGHHWAHRCLATSRKRVASEGWGDKRDDARRERLLGQPGAGDQAKLTKSLATMASQHPRIGNGCAVGTLESEVARVNRSASHHIFRTSVGDLVYATSAEVSLPKQDVVKAIQKIIAARSVNDVDSLHHTSPFGVRFSQASKHYLSMAYGRETCTIEAPLLLGTRAYSGRFKHEPSEKIMSRTLRRFCDNMRDVIPSARFHHGQRNWNTRVDLEAYPQFDKWLAQYRRFNSFGVFSNELSKSWGLDA